MPREDPSAIQLTRSTRAPLETYIAHRRQRRVDGDSKTSAGGSENAQRGGGRGAAAGRVLRKHLRVLRLSDEG